VVVRASRFHAEEDAKAALADVAIVETSTASKMLLELVAPVIPPGEPGSFEADLELEVPPHVEVSVVTTGKPIIIIGARVAELETSYAAIELTDTSGQARLVNDDGPIDVVGHAGDISARTGNAETRLHEIVGNVDVYSSGGAITASVLPTFPGWVHLETLEGPIDLALPFDWIGGATAIADAVIIDDPRGDFLYLPEDLIDHGDSGAPTPLVDLHTQGGNITLRPLLPAF